jgi:hypothetical protein
MVGERVAVQRVASGRLERPVHGEQTGRQHQWALETVRSSVGLQRRPVGESVLARDDELCVVQRDGRGITAASTSHADKRFCVAQAHAVQQCTGAFALVFEIEPGHSILLLCLRPRVG